MSPVAIILPLINTDPAEFCCPRAPLPASCAQCLVLFSLTMTMSPWCTSNVGVMTERFDVNSQGISYMLTHKVKLQFVCFWLFIGNERI